MSAHRPTGVIEIDVFDDDVPLASPEEAAVVLWDTIKRWVEKDDRPIVKITMENDKTYTVDLGAERGVCTFCQHAIWHNDEDGWVAPDAGIHEDGDGIWRETCPDNHESREAPHEPEEG